MPISWSTETNLGFTFVKEFKGSDTTARVRFFDLVTGLPRVPDSNTKILVAEKDTERYEIFAFDTKTEIDADKAEYDLENCTRNLKWQGYLLVTAGAVEFSHGESSGGRTVDIHYLMAIPWAIMQGLIATGAQDFYGGDGQNTPQYFGLDIDIGAGAQKRRIFRLNTDGKVSWSDNNGASWNLLETAGNHGNTANISQHTQVHADADNPSQYDVLGWITGNIWSRVNYKLAMPTIDIPIVYTPAALAGGTGAQSDHTVWAAESNARARLTDVDGTAYDLVMNFSTVASMDDVAGVWQAAIRAATGGQETVTWDTDHLDFASADTTSASAFGFLTTHSGGGGTDVHGAGWAEGDSGNATQTEKALNLSFYNDYIVLLENGLIDENFLGNAIVNSLLTTKGDMIVRTANGIVRIPAGTDGQKLVVDSSDDNGVKWVDDDNWEFISSDLSNDIGTSTAIPAGATKAIIDVTTDRHDTTFGDSTKGQIMLFATGLTSATFRGYGNTTVKWFAATWDGGGGNITTSGNSDNEGSYSVYFFK